jgi:5-methylcytosine-specific restriction endonuclease McrA
MAVMIRMNGLDQGKGYFYCTDECKNTCPLYRQKTYYRDQRPYVTEHINSIHPQLRDMCFERDKYECQICGEKKDLRCHHIDPIINNPIESADLDNVITLCNNCHKKSHQLPKCSTGYLSKGCINGY